jgi:hypothetical protein
VSLSFGLYDIFAYAVPGSLYLALGAYIAGRLKWIALGQLFHLPTIILVGGIIVLSYLLGFVTYPLGSSMDRVLRVRKRSADARSDFLARVPGAENRPYIHADMALLKGAAEVFEADSTQEISRLRAVGIMTRNCSVPLIIACGLSIVTAAQGIRVEISVTGIFVFAAAAAAAAAIWQGRRFRHWSNMKTLEICYWIDGIDELVQSGHRPKRRAGGQSRPRRPSSASPPGSPPASSS